MSDTNTAPTKVQNIQISSNNAGQRIDNFLLSQLKGVPKTRIYKILRSGEVRVNKGRIKPSFRLSEGDIVRVPPVRMAQPQEHHIPDFYINLINNSTLFENDDLLIINKPSGLAVHAGSNINYGVIDILRELHGKDQFIELVHRLDRATSGCLILAKNRDALLGLQKLFKSSRAMQKKYLALTLGNWPEGETRVDLPLSKNELRGGERIVTVDPEGKTSVSLFLATEQFDNASLVEVTLLTGRTHQIRVHSASQQHPIAGDEKYGDKTFNQAMKKLGLKRMFLHARSVEFDFNGPIKVTAPLDENLQSLLTTLRNSLTE